MVLALAPKKTRHIFQKHPGDATWPGSRAAGAGVAYGAWHGHAPAPRGLHGTARAGCRPQWGRGRTAGPEQLASIGTFHAWSPKRARMNSTANPGTMRHKHCVVSYQNLRLDSVLKAATCKISKGSGGKLAHACPARIPDVRARCWTANSGSPPSRLLAIAHHRGVRAVRWRWLVLCHTRVAPCEPRRRARDGARASARHADERAGGGRRLRSTPARTVSLHHRPVSCFLSSKTLSPKEKKAQTLSFFETPRKK